MLFDEFNLINGIKFKNGSKAIILGLLKIYFQYNNEIPIFVPQSKIIGQSFFTVLDAIKYSSFINISFNSASNKRGLVEIIEKHKKL